MKTTTLGELLTDEQIERVMDIIASTTRQDRIAKLKEYFNSFKDELERKGVIADFLAYLVEHMLSEHQQQKDAHANN
jgi:hypothetical protein